MPRRECGPPASITSGSWRSSFRYAQPHSDMTAQATTKSPPTLLKTSAVPPLSSGLCGKFGRTFCWGFCWRLCGMCLGRLRDRFCGRLREAFRERFGNAGWVGDNPVVLVVVSMKDKRYGPLIGDGAAISLGGERRYRRSEGTMRRRCSKKGLCFVGSGDNLAKMGSLTSSSCAWYLWSDSGNETGLSSTTIHSLSDICHFLRRSLLGGTVCGSPLLPLLRSGTPVRGLAPRPSKKSSDSL